MPSEPKLMKIRDIQHLFTPIEGNIEQQTDIFDFVQALHPTPALGGVPTKKSMEISREKERQDRGKKGGQMGEREGEGKGREREGKGKGGKRRAERENEGRKAGKSGR